MSYIASGLIILMSMFKKKSKVIYCIFLGLLWILFGFNFNNPDYLNYKYTYDFVFQATSGEISEPLFLLLIKSFNLMGITYQTFVCVVSFIGLFLIAIRIWELSPYPHMVLVLYFIFPFSIDVVQLRFFLAMSIVIFSIGFVLDFYRYRKVKDMFFFLLCIAIATGIHYSSVLYCIILLPCFTSYKFRYLFIVYAIILVGFITFKLDIIVPVVGELLSISKIEKWLIPDFKATIPMIIRILVIRYGWLLICFCACFSKKKEVMNRENLILDKENNFIFSIILSLVSLTALEMFVNTEYERLSRVTLILGYILITRCIERMTNHAIPMWLVMFGYIIAYFCFSMTFRFVIQGEVSWFEGVFRTVFENNLIFGS